MPGLLKTETPRFSTSVNKTRDLGQNNSQYCGPKVLEQVLYRGPQSNFKGHWYLFAPLSPFLFWCLLVKAEHEEKKVPVSLRVTGEPSVFLTPGPATPYRLLMMHWAGEPLEVRVHIEPSPRPNGGVDPSGVRLKRDIGVTWGYAGI